MPDAYESMGSVDTEPAGVRGAVLHLARQVLRSRLLVAYLVLGVLSGLAVGLEGLGSALVNYLILLPLYTLIIYLWTRGKPTLLDEFARDGDAPARWRDLALVGVLFVLSLGNAAWFWAGGPPSSVQRPVLDALSAAGWERELAGTVANGVGNTLFSLMPAILVVFLVFRLRPRQVALIPRDVGLAAVLVAIGVALAGLVYLFTGQSTNLFRGLEAVPLALAVALARVFVNGLPEEFVYRGAIMGSLLRVLRRPQTVLVLSSILFVVSHVPSYVAQGVGFPLWTLAFITPGPQPTGLIWGYLCYRTRSIWPGVFWHVSFTTLGILFV